MKNIKNSKHQISSKSVLFIKRFVIKWNWPFYINKIHFLHITNSEHRKTLKNGCETWYSRHSSWSSYNRKNFSQAQRSYMSEISINICLPLQILCHVFSSPVNVVDFCGQTIRDDGMIVNSHQESKKYYFVTMGTDCHLTMQASSPKDKVQFYFRFFLVYSLLRVAPLSPAPVLPESPRGSAPFNPRLEPTSGESSGDPCHAGSYVQFYDGRDRSSPPLGPPLCGKSPPRPVLSTGNYLTLRLVTRGTQPRVDFVGDFTSFRLGKTEAGMSIYFPNVILRSMIEWQYHKAIAVMWHVKVCGYLCNIFRPLI